MRRGLRPSDQGAKLSRAVADAQGSVHTAPNQALEPTAYSFGFAPLRSALPAAAHRERSAAKRERREPPIEHETLEPQEMIDGLVQVLREVYANDTF